VPSRSPRVFIGLNEVAGLYTSLQQGLEELGIPTMRIDEGGNPRGYRPARSKDMDGQVRPFHDGWARLAAGLERASLAVSRRRRKARGAARFLWAAAGGGVLAMKTTYRAALLVNVIAAYDVVLLTGGSSFFRGRELPLLRRVGKRVVVVFAGSDHRPAFLNGRLLRTMSTDEIIEDARRTHRYVRLAERHATAVVAASCSAQFHRRPFVLFMALGVPFEPAADEESRRAPVFTGRGIRILHSPSDPISKGTPVVRELIARLRAEGIQIDFVEITDRPHSEVLAALSECDFAVDELYSDTPLGRFATEAAWFAKPAVTAGEYSRAMADEVPPAFIPPATFVPLEEVEAAVRAFISDPGYRDSCGAAIQAFVQGEWSPAAVARRFLRVIRDDVPEEWLCDPARLTYVGGYGLAPDAWKASVGAVVEAAGGVDQLGLNESSARSLKERLNVPSA
jgi:hypothetical protein